MLHSRILPAAVACALLIGRAASAAPDDGAQFAIPHQRIDIGGRALNLFCSGEGAPVVLFEAPGGHGGWNWFKVVPDVARHSRACIYDRAGLGFSDASPRPSDSANAVEDLHALLGAAAIAGPYVMVGSSYGAMHAQLYAYRYPSEIAGLILVDGQNEDEEKFLDLVTDGMFAKMAPGALAAYRDCAEGAAAGKLSDQCQGEEAGGSGATLAAAIERARQSAVYWRARESESASYLAASGTELHQARQKFADFPLLILARSISPFRIPGQPPSPRNRAGEDVHKASLEVILALAPKGEMRVVPEAGHLIQIDQPKAVSEAVIEMVEKVRAAAPKTR